jgi:hypothetical protein
MVVDIDNYNVLLGLDVLINIGARMDIKEAWFMSDKVMGLMCKCFHLTWSICCNWLWNNQTILRGPLAR